MNRDQFNEAVNYLLLNWTIIDNDNCKEHSFSELKRIYNGPAQSFSVFMNLILKENIIFTKPNGYFLLTEKAFKMAKEIQNYSENYDAGKVVTNEGNWRNFRKLLTYYTMCTERSFSSQFYLHNGKYGKQFSIPKALDYGWLQGLDEKPKRITLGFTKEERAIQTTLQLSGYDDTSVYIGYPVLARFDSYSNAPSYYVPLSLIPIEVKNEKIKKESFKDNKVEVELDFKNAILNRTWMQYALDEEDHKRVEKAIEMMDDGTAENRGRIDLKAILPIIMSYSKYSNIAIDSNSLEQVLPQKNKGRGKTTLCNTAVIFEAKEIVYTKNLLKELKQISKATVNELDKTSLAYVFREPPLKDYNLKREVVPFIPSNTNQQKAVEKAINHPVFQLQGPPGTGKSQVAVNIIANCVYNKETVLFSSRNNQAVEAIRDRARSILDDSSVVNFCAKDELRKSWWYEEKITDIVADLQAASKTSNEFEEENLSRLLDSLSKVRTEFDGIANVSEQIQEAKLKYQSNLQQLKAIFNKDGFVIDVDIPYLKSAEDVLKKKRILDIISYFKRKKEMRIISDFRKMYSKSSASLKDAEVLKTINITCKLVDQLKEIEEKSSTLSDDIDIERLDPICVAFNELEEKIEASNKKRALFSIFQKQSSLDDESLAQIENLLKAGRTKKLKVEEIKKDLLDSFYDIIPAWAVTLLSVHHASPLIPGIFDQVVIDEASQCDPICAIPALFRAKRVTMIGDPKQFATITELPNRINNSLWNAIFKDDYSLIQYKIGESSAYSLLSGKAENNMLREHYRCTTSIASFFNKEFYENKLIIQTRDMVPLVPSCIPNNNNIHWIDGKNTEEAQVSATIELLREINDSNYKGTIGIICPLADVVSDIWGALAKSGIFIDEERVKIGSSYSFQGGQEDTIIFVTGYTKTIPKGKKWYLTSKENRNIYNVTVSRAKSCLVIIGDKDLIMESESRELRALASIEQLSSLAYENNYGSVPEKMFHEAADKAGLKLITQYYFKSYFLDFAYVTDTLKLNIEIDGRPYHFTAQGDRLEKDIVRDSILKANGWNVIRYTASEIDNDIKFVIDNLLAQIEFLRKNPSKNETLLHSRRNKIII